MKIGVVSQKGGVGKSSIARLIAIAFASNDWDVKIADMDISQGTAYNWAKRRMDNEIEPSVSIEPFKKVEAALRQESNYDLIVFDGAPRSTATTLEIAQTCDLTIIPTGTSNDDLEPTVRLCHDFRKNGIPQDKFIVAFNRVGSSDLELQDAQDYMEQAGYPYLKNHLKEKTGYRRASDAGQCFFEISWPSLKEHAEDFVKEIVALCR